MEVIGHFGARYAFLSNFSASPITVTLHGGAVPVKTVEHAFQAAKCLNPDEAISIATAPTPAIAKALGKTCHSIRPDWEAVRETVMLEALRLKFEPTGALASLLLETFPKVLIEGNTWNDRYWGVCDGEGQNRLGTLLMQVRGELRRPRLL
jgi:ribA/ribD-fused uncharacterized protein